MAELKTKLTQNSVDAFIKKIPDAEKRADTLTVVEMMRKITRAEPKMWGASIIGFGSYRYEYASGRTGDWPMIGLSPRKQNLTLYVMHGADSFASLRKKLGPHTTGKSCLYIKRLADVDRGALEKIVTLSVAEMKKKYPPAKKAPA
jgi:hypothetical protein